MNTVNKKICTEILGENQFEYFQSYLNNEEEKVLIIIGYHNSGKTTLLNQIQNKITLSEASPKRWIERIEGCTKSIDKNIIFCTTYYYLSDTERLIDSFKELYHNNKLILVMGKYQEDYEEVKGYYKIRNYLILHCNYKFVDNPTDDYEKLRIDFNKEMTIVKKEEKETGRCVI